MNQLISTKGPVAPVHSNIIRTAWNSGEIGMMRRNLAPDATAGEFEMYLGYCQAKGLDPMKGDAILVVYGKDRKDKRKATIITTQGGYRTIAARCGGYHPAKPADTVWTYTEMHLARQELLNAAVKQLKETLDRPAYLERVNAINTAMPPDPQNPFGLLECRTVIYKNGVPCEGIAFWSDFAPLKPDDACYEWVGTGETYADSGKEKRRKRIKPGINPLDHLVLDTSGQWGSASRNMLEKCASVKCLKAGFPDHFDDRYQTEETMARTAAEYRTFSELADIDEQERRQKAIGQNSKEEYQWSDLQGNDGIYPADKFGDAVLRTVRACQYYEDVERLKSLRLNTEYFRRFWAAHKNDGLDINIEIEKLRSKLPHKPAQAAVIIDHREDEGVPAHA